MTNVTRRKTCTVWHSTYFYRDFVATFLLLHLVLSASSAPTVGITSSTKKLPNEVSLSTLITVFESTPPNIDKSNGSESSNVTRTASPVPSNNEQTGNVSRPNSVVAEESNGTISTTAGDNRVESTSPTVGSAGQSSNLSDEADGSRVVHPVDDTGAIVGIVIGVLLFVAIVTGAGVYTFLYVYKKEKKPPPSVSSTIQFAGDTNSYIDDTIRVSYINNHIELPKVMTIREHHC
ncbi:Uncharacterised protein g8111 [Pycnogonum litorale]